MIVERMKELQMQERHPLGLRRETPHRSTGPVIIRLRPPVPPLDDADPVGPQEMQFAQRRADHQRLDESIARQQQMPIERLEKVRPAHPSVRLAQQCRRRVLRPLPLALIDQPRHGRRRLGHQPDTAMRHRVLHEPFARQGGIRPPRPARLPLRRQRQQRPRRLLLGHGTTPRPRQERPDIHDDVLC